MPATVWLPSVASCPAVYDQQTRHARVRKTGPNGWVVSTIVLAVVSVVLAGALVVSWGGGDTEPSTTSAASSAELGCRLLDETPEDGYDEDAAGVADAHRLTVIGALGYLAGEQDDKYDDLADKLGELMNAAARLTLTEPEFPATLADARDACGEHGW